MASTTTTTTTTPNNRSLSLDRKQTNLLNTTILEESESSYQPSITTTISASTPIPFYAEIPPRTFPSPYPSPSSFRHLILHHCIECTRLGLTTLVILLGITVLGTSADVLSVYSATHVGKEFFLPLWGVEDVRGEVAILVSGAVVVFTSGIGLIGERIHTLSRLFRTFLGFAAPFAGLVTSIVAVALQYHVQSRADVSSLQSWSCQWKGVVWEKEVNGPNFGGVCRESRVALSLDILLIPLEFIVLGLAIVERQFPGITEFESRKE